MSNGKYSNLLTGLLILAILAVVGLLIFFGIDLFNKFYLDKEVSKGADQFDRLIPDINTNNTNDLSYSYNEIFMDMPENNTVEDNIVNPFANMETDNTTSNSSTSTTASSTKKVVYYKGFVQVGNISIPRTGLSCPVLEKETKSSLEVAVAVRTGPGVNEIGNTVIAGHNYRNGSLFSKNKLIQVGDKINLKDTNGRVVTYIVYNKFDTTPEDTSYMSKDTEGKREVTLVTCNDDSSRRIIVEAREQ